MHEQAFIMCQLSDHGFVMTARGGLRRVDACVRALVQHLNDIGITTYDSCCGHGRRFGHVTIGRADADRARALGFRVCCDGEASSADYPFVAFVDQVNIILPPVIPSLIPDAASSTS